MLGHLTQNFVAPVVVSSAFVMGILALGLFLLCVRRYEVALLMILASAWIRCFFIKNEFVPLVQVESNPGTYMRLGLVAMVGVIGYLKFFQARAASREKLPLHLTCLGAFLFFALFSATYSLSRSFTLGRVVEFLAFYGFLLGLHYWLKDKANVDKALNTLFLVTSIGMLVNISSLFLLRSHVWFFESPNRFQGVMGEPNHLGAVLMVSYVIFMWKYVTSDSRGKTWATLFFLIALTMHGLSGSRSSTFSAVIGFFVWAIVLKQTKMLGLLLIIMAWGVIVIAIVGLPSLEREQATEDSIMDLTGRTNIWEKAVQVLKERPLQGYGYQVGGEIFTKLKLSSKDYFLNDSTTARFQLHNGYLSVAVGCGIPCLLLWLAVLLLPLLKSLSLPMSPYKALGIVMIVQCMTLNCVEDFVSCASRMMPSMFFWIGWVICGKLPSLPIGAASGERFVFAEEAPLGVHGAVHEEET